MKYTSEKLEEISYALEGESVNLTYRVLLESMYFSPGVNIREEENKTYLDIVRCKVAGTCDVQYVSHFNEDGSQSVTIKAPIDPSAVWVEGENGNKLITDY
ncbi:hypothetical protein [Neptunomonas sp.]|uniref:hypothetical protein n=1 Tax=Neptunomonas sp. TaxID=1971898 RepID=UPI0025DA639A|nr:hypothetical protein [Neptunomonas sp.]